jgi:hypothetical protein
VKFESISGRGKSENLTQSFGKQAIEVIPKNQVHPFSGHFNAPVNDLWGPFKSLRTLWNDEHVSDPQFPTNRD